MTLVQAVTAAVLERGKATAKDLAPLFPDMSDEQIRAALRNAKYRGFLRRANTRHGGAKRYEAEWAGPDFEPEPEPEPEREKPAASVWDYAQRAA